MPITENKKHLVHYVPHGIDPKKFRPIEKNDPKLLEFKTKLLGTKEYDFVVFFNSRNMWRKKAPNLILAFRTFCDNLPKEKAAKCVLFLHTEDVSDAGTDLNAVKDALCKDYDVIINNWKFHPNEMTYIYNLADVTVNISSNEGFGLSVAESIMSGIPVIVNCTGGIQDQIGQTDDKGLPVKFDINYGTNSDGRYKNHGKWAKVVYPAVRTLQGSPATPYILDDFCKWEDVAEAIMYWYMMETDERILCGIEGRNWACGEGGLNAKHMCDEFIKAIDYTLTNFKPSKAFDIYKMSEQYVGHAQPDNSPGFEIPKINIDKIKGELNAEKL